MSGFYPFNAGLGQQMQTGVEGVVCDRGFIAHLVWYALEAVAASTTGIHAAVNGASGAAVEVTTGFTQPSCPKNVTATAGGTAGDIKATQIIVEGHDIAGAVISETLPAFTVDTAGTVTGSKIFADITKYTIPIQDGNGATFALGFGEKLGLPFKLAHNTNLASYKGGTKEGTAATVAVDASNFYGNSIDLNSALDGNIVDAYFIV